jgi:hypothetical protein
VRARRLSIVGTLVAIAAASSAARAEPAASTVAGFTLHGGGYLQPQLRLREDDAVAPFDEDGFRVRRARLIGAATRTLHRVTIDVAVEAELTPEPRLLDAAVAVSGCLLGDGGWRVDAGQFKVPVSRQTLLSDSRLGFVEKAELAGLAPDRQIGAMVTLVVPEAPWVRLSGGLWNGEGPNQSGNVDQRYLWAGRFELRALGRGATLAESALAEPTAWLGASAARQQRDVGDGLETQVTLGVDVAAAWHGASASVEYLQVTHDFDAVDRLDFRANGLVAQLGYLLPVAAPGDVEVAVRFEEIDRNDAVPIVRRGDPDQSLRYFTAGASWYLDGHDLKLQATGSHIVEIEDRDAMRSDARYANDTLLVQATVRIE